MVVITVSPHTRSRNKNVRYRGYMSKVFTSIEANLQQTALYVCLSVREVFSLEATWFNRIGVLPCLSFARLDLSLQLKYVKEPQTKVVGLVFVKVRVEESMYLPHLDQHHLVSISYFMSIYIYNIIIIGYYRSKSTRGNK